MGELKSSKSWKIYMNDERFEMFYGMFIPTKSAFAFRLLF